MSRTLNISKYLRLIAAFVLFILVYYVSFYLSTSVSNISPAFSLFLGATILTLLCVLIIYRFSQLALHRTQYLLIGALALLALAYAATPMVNRGKLINSVALNQAASFECSFVSNSDYSLGQKLILAHKKTISADIISFLSENIKESREFILLLALAQLTLATGIGLWIGEGIDKVSHLIPVALVAGLADIWSVFAGATSAIILSPNMNYFFLRFPVLADASIPYLIGLTDYLFCAIFYQSAVRFKLGARKNMFVLIASFLVTVAFALTLRIGLPVLPFMGALFILINMKNLHIDKEEKRQMLVFMLVVGIIFFVITQLMH